MLEMLMLLGFGLAAAGLAGMTGLSRQAPAGAARTAGSGFAEEGEGGAGEDMLSQVRRLGGAFDITRLMPALAGKSARAAETARKAADEAVQFSGQADQARFQETPAAPEEDHLVFDGLLSLLPEGDEADMAENISAALEPAPSAAAEPAEEDDIPVITDFAAGAEQVLLMLPEGMAEDTTVSIELAGPEGHDAAVVLEDAQGSLTAVIVAGAYGSLGAADVVIERAA